jgi:opacity protein-like surface antigen
MKRTVFMVLLSALLFIPLLGEAATKKVPQPSATRIDFFAYDEEEERQKEKPWERLRVVGFGGAGYPEMDALNGYIDWINTTADGRVAHINHYWRYGFGIEFPFSNGFYAGMGYERIEVDAEGTTIFMATTNNFSIDLEVDGGEIYVGKVWPRIAGPLAAEVVAGAGYYVSDYRERENGYDISGDDKEPGFRLGGGLAYGITNNLALSVEVNYRWLKFDEYEDGDDIITFVSPGNPPVEVDFSGMTVNGTIRWRF